MQTVRPARQTPGARTPTVYCRFSCAVCALAPWLSAAPALIPRLPLLAKIVVALVFIGILVSLGSGFVYMLKDKGQTDRAVKALTVRVAISVGLFVLLFVMWWLGWITPHGAGT